MKYKLKKIACLAMFISSVGLFGSANAQTEISPVDTSSLTGVTERGKALFSDYICMENLNFGPETKHVSKSGEQFYTKNIIVNKDISKINDDATLDSRAKINLDVTFTYDKNSYVKIKNPKNDVKTSKTSDKWKIGDVTEIYPGKNSYLVSTTYSVFKKSATGLGDKILDGHIDIMCSKYGDIGLDTELD